MNATGAAAANKTIGYTRMVLFTDTARNNSDTLPAFKDIFKEMTGPLDPPNVQDQQQWSFRELENLERFKIHSDKTHYFNLKYFDDTQTGIVLNTDTIKGITIGRNLNMDLTFTLMVGFKSFL